MEWFRWYTETTKDPKWIVVSRRAKCSVADVVAVWATMMESVPDGSDTLTGWGTEDVAAQLGIEEATVIAIHSAMQGKTLEGDRLTGWRKRQPKREDPTAADRKRAQRDRQKSREGHTESHNVTHGHAASRGVTPEEKRGDKKRIEGESPKPPLPPPSTESSSNGRRTATELPEAWTPTEAHQLFAETLELDLDGEAEKFRTYHRARGSEMRNWDAAFLSWLQKADRYDTKRKRGRDDPDEPPTFEGTVWADL